MTWSVIRIIVRFLIRLCSGLFVRGWLLSLLGMRFLLGLGLLLMHRRLGLCLRLEVSFWLSLGLLLLGRGLLLLRGFLLGLGLRMKGRRRLRIDLFGLRRHGGRYWFAGEGSIGRIRLNL